VAKAGVFISVVGKNDPKAFDAARSDLKRLEAQARTTSSGIEGALARASSKFDSIGRSMLGVGKKMSIGVTLPIVGGLALAAKAGADEDKAMALLANSLQRNAGLTRAQVAAQEQWITKTQNATGVLDDDLRPALSKLVVAGHSVSQAHREIGIAMDIAASRGKPLNTVIDAMVKASNGSTGALARMGIKTTEMVGGGAALTKAQLAVEKATTAAGLAFGKYGKDSIQGRTAAAALADAQAKLSAVQETGTKRTLTYDEVLKRASATMGGSAAKAADTASGRMAILKARFGDLVENIGRKVIPIGEKLVGFLGSLISGFSGLPDGVQTAVVVFALLAAAIGPVVSICGAFAVALGFILSPVGLVVAAIAILVGAVALVATHWEQVWGAIRDNPALAVIAALLFPILIPIVAIGGAIHWLADNWQAVWAGMQDALAEFRGFLAPLVAFVQAKLDQIGVWVDKNAATFQAAFDNIATVVRVAVDAIAAVLGFLIDNVVAPAFEWWLSVAVPILEAAWVAIQAVISGAIAIVEGIIQTVMSLIAGDWSGAWNGILLILSGVWSIITGLIGFALSYVQAIISGALSAIAGIFSAGWNLLVSIVTGAWNGIYAAVVGAAGALIAFVSGLPGQIIGFFADLPGRMLTLGGQIVDGIKNGIGDAWGKLVSWAKNKAQDLLDSITSIFDPGSPSKVTTKLGRQIVDGLRVGMGEELGALGAMADKVSAAAMPSITGRRAATLAALPSAGGAGAGGFGNGSGGGNVVYLRLDVSVDARGASDPDAVRAAARRGASDGATGAVRELTRMSRAS
jgi:phage-related protein